MRRFVEEVGRRLCRPAPCRKRVGRVQCTAVGLYVGQQLQHPLTRPARNQDAISEGGEDCLLFCIRGGKVSEPIANPYLLGIPP